MRASILYLLMVLATCAQPFTVRDPAFVGNAYVRVSGGGGGGGALLDDSLDYVDSAAAVSAGWVNSASAPDWHYTTSPAPLGSYGYTSSFSDPSGLRYATRSFTASDEVWIYFVFYTPTGAGNNYWIYVLDASDNILGQIRNIGDTTIRAMNGTAFTGTSYATTTGTKYVCFRYKRDTGGNNGIASAYISTSTTLPGTPTDTTSSGTSTAQASKVRIGFGNDNTVRVLYQRLKVFTSDQGTTFP